MRVRVALCAVAVCLSLGRVAMAQDAVKADPKHYSVISENDQVRILKVHYEPHEKSVMHSHPNSVVVYLTNGKTKMTMPDGKSSENVMKAGSAMYVPAGTHLPENVGDKATDVIVVELKK